MKPNLFIIGAMKSGTSSLHAYIGEHPDIFMCEPKEPGYFVPAIAAGRTLEWYLSLFQDARNVTYCGESSTHYTKHPFYSGVPSRIAEFQSRPRLIYMMRDPVERAISHYWHMVRWHRERKPMLRAFQTDPIYLTFSDYPKQLMQWMDAFPSELFWIDTFEKMRSDPQEFCSRLFEWLGVDGSFSPRCLDEVFNGTPRCVTRREAGIVHRFRHSAMWSALGPLVPPILRKSVLELTQRSFDRNDEKSSAETDKATSYLEEELAGTVEHLKVMLGKEFEEWPRFAGVKEADA